MHDTMCQAMLATRSCFFLCQAMLAIHDHVLLCVKPCGYTWPCCSLCEAIMAIHDHVLDLCQAKLATHDHVLLCVKPTWLYMIMFFFVSSHLCCTWWCFSLCQAILALHDYILTCVKPPWLPGFCIYDDYISGDSRQENFADEHLNHFVFWLKSSFSSSNLLCILLIQIWSWCLQLNGWIHGLFTMGTSGARGCMIQDGLNGVLTGFSIFSQFYWSFCLCLYLLVTFWMHQSTLPCSPGLMLKQEPYHGLDALIKTGRFMWTGCTSNFLCNIGVGFKMVCSHGAPLAKGPLAPLAQVMMEMWIWLSQNLHLKLLPPARNDLNKQSHSCWNLIGIHLSLTSSILEVYFCLNWNMWLWIQQYEGDTLINGFWKNKCSADLRFASTKMSYVVVALHNTSESFAGWPYLGIHWKW